MISIIFPTFKRSSEVKYNLEFFRENISIPYEVFVLDNSPESMKYDFEQNEKYIFLNKNIGTSSRNAGIKQANAPICLLLDDDSHPFPGTVEKIVEDFKSLPNDCAGLISEIHNPDGGREATLLPTVFHGAGVAFKTEALIENDIFYPENYCFYGEEYRMTLEIYRAGFHLKESTNFKVMHRRSNKGRDLNKIFYYLGRNNRAIWEDIVPEKYRKQVIYDSQRRYELTSAKEGVSEAFAKGLSEEIKSPGLSPMSEAQFEKYALIDKIKSLPGHENYTLCGAGKFPSLWAQILKDKKCHTNIGDFNPGLSGQHFNKSEINTSEDILFDNTSYILGHGSSTDSSKWSELLKQNNREYIDIHLGNELHAC